MIMRYFSLHTHKGCSTGYIFREPNLFKSENKIITITNYN